MKKRNSIIRVIIAFVLVSSLLFLSGCLDITIPAKKAAISSLDMITFFGSAGSLNFRFSDSTVTYENSIIPDLSGTFTLNSEDAAEYHELLRAMCQEMFDEGEKYAPTYTLQGELTRRDSNISVLYRAKGSETSDISGSGDLFVQNGEDHPRPARWDEFTKRVKELAGCDVEALLFDPYGSETQEVKELSRVEMYFDKGYINFSFDAGDDIYCGMYGPEKAVSGNAKDMTEIKYRLRAICDDIVLHENDYSQDLSASDMNESCQIKIEYSDGTSRKEKTVWLGKGGVRAYPEHWNELMSLIKNYTGFDTADLIAAPGEVIPFGKVWRACDVVYAAPQTEIAFTPETAPVYGLFNDGWLFGSEGLPEFWENISAATLSKENFDDLFISFDAANIRKDIKQAWRYEAMDDVNGTFCYLIITNPGELYLACGSTADKAASASDKESLVNWMFRLEYVETL